MIRFRGLGWVVGRKPQVPTRCKYVLLTSAWVVHQDREPPHGPLAVVSVYPGPPAGERRSPCSGHLCHWGPAGRVYQVGDVALCTVGRAAADRCPFAGRDQPFPACQQLAEDLALALVYRVVLQARPEPSEGDHLRGGRLGVFDGPLVAVQEPEEPPGNVEALCSACAPACRSSPPLSQDGRGQRIEPLFGALGLGDRHVRDGAADPAVAVVERWMVTNHKWAIPARPLAGWHRARFGHPLHLAVLGCHPAFRQPQPPGDG